MWIAGLSTLDKYGDRPGGRCHNPTKMMERGRKYCCSFLSRYALSDMNICYAFTILIRAPITHYLFDDIGILHMCIWQALHHRSLSKRFTFFCNTRMSTDYL